MLVYLFVYLFIHKLTAFEHTNYEESPDYLEDFAVPGTRNTRQASPNYICVPPGTCATNSSFTIDPRIVTTGAACVAPKVACYMVPNGAQCGQRYVSQISLADGPSTFGAHPWQAYLLNQTGFTGSGVLLDEYHVLTAAHKVDLNCLSPQNLGVYIGYFNPFSNQVVHEPRNVVKIAINANYDPLTLKNDIAILRLDRPISLGYQINIGTACLPAKGASFENNACVVAGWGRSSFAVNDAPTSPQKQVNVRITNLQTCLTSMRSPDILGPNADIYLDKTGGELCAGGEFNKDACTSDGGSPLICLNSNTGRYTIAGLVIWGKNCGKPNVFGVYVNVASYIDWITLALTRIITNTVAANCKV